MKYGNIGKAIAFASLWFYAAFTKVIAQDTSANIIWLVAIIMSFVVIYLFDKGPVKKTE